jgi:hypothetical protein
VAIGFLHDIQRGPRRKQSSGTERLENTCLNKGFAKLSTSCLPQFYVSNARRTRSQGSKEKAESKKKARETNYQPSSTCHTILTPLFGQPNCRVVLLAPLSLANNDTQNLPPKRSPTSLFVNGAYCLVTGIKIQLGTAADILGSAMLKHPQR